MWPCREDDFVGSHAMSAMVIRDLAGPVASPAKSAVPPEAEALSANEKISVSNWYRYPLDYDPDQPARGTTTPRSPSHLARVRTTSTSPKNLPHGGIAVKGHTVIALRRDSRRSAYLIAPRLGGPLGRVRNPPIATKFRRTAKWRDGAKRRHSGGS